MFTTKELLDTISLDDFLVDKKEATYFLKVSSDSMTEAGIMKGDYVLVERGRQPKAGDIVLAEADGEFSLKYYRSGRKMMIAAVVVAVVRKYGKSNITR